MKHLCLTILVFSCIIKDIDAQIVVQVNDNTKSGHLIYMVESKKMYDRFFIDPVDSAAADGTGNVTLRCNCSGGFYRIVTRTLSVHHEDLFLQPGDSLHVVIREDQKPLISGNARAAFVNSYPHHLSELFWNEEASKRQRESTTLPPVEFAEYMSDRTALRDSILQSYFAGRAEEFAEYIRFQKAKAVQHYAGRVFHYMRYLKYYTTGTWAYAFRDTLPFMFQPELLLNENEYYFTFDYNDIIRGMIEEDWETWRKEVEDSLAWDKKMLHSFEAAKRMFTGRDRDIAFAVIARDFSTSYLRHDSFFVWVPMIKDFVDENFTDPFYLAYFKAKYDAAFSLREGNPAPDFTLPDHRGRMVSLSDFRGKVVFIDFWGTWCGPCIASIPDHRKLQDTLAGEDVIFLNVAMEWGPEEIARWKKFLKKEDFPGVHVVASRQFRNPDIADYQINAAPTYVIVDREGRIAVPRAATPGHAYDQIMEVLAR